MARLEKCFKAEIRLWVRAFLRCGTDWTRSRRELGVMDELLTFELWPSLDELGEGQPADLYFGTSVGFWNSIRELKDDLMDKGTYLTRPDGQPLSTLTQNLIPPEVYEFAAGVIQGGTATAAATILYKAIKLWLDRNRGRKFKVKFAGLIEVEASGVSEKTFTRIIETVANFMADVENGRGPNKSLELLTLSLNGEGIPQRSTNSTERKDELRELFHKGRRPA
jgi:hypothetical protein